MCLPPAARCAFRGTHALGPLSLLLLTGCFATAPRYAGPLTEGWARETLQRSTTTCSGRSCRWSVSLPGGGLQVRTEVRGYPSGKVPGWEESFGQRAAVSIASWLLRQKGWTTGETVVVLGTREVSGASAGDLVLRCSVFWLDDEESVYDANLDQSVTYVAERKAHGVRCGAFAAEDTATARWRVWSGVVPPLDSVAGVYDALVAADSPELGPFPPLTLECLTEEGDPAVRYQLDQEAWGHPWFPLRVRVAREDGTAIAMVHAGSDTAVDTAPEATPEERQVLLLIAGLLMATVEFAER
jgi:hypothetical protein